MGKMFLTVVDSRSKWLEVELKEGITSEETTEKLREIFVRYGILKPVSDNSPQFTSQEFSKFAKAKGIKQKLVAS